MTVKLSAEEQLKFSNIMFQSQGREQNQIQNLNQQQRQKLKSLYAQKIAYDTVNPTPIQQGMNETNYNKTAAPGIVGTVCCCFMPENNKDKFDITSSLFMKRILGGLMFFKGGFLSIGEPNTELYGYLWLSLSYIVILGIAANLNQYFVLPKNYAFDTTLMVEGLGICAVFFISEPFIYAAVSKCLGGYVNTIQSMMLCGYSLVLYFIPTLACLLPSLYWHVGMLSLQALLRALFLWRNYGSKIQANSLPILVVAVLIEALFGFSLLRVMFRENSGYGFSNGADQVFGHQSVRIFYQ